MTAITTFWTGIASIIPPKYHQAGTTILTALTTALALFMKSGQSPQREAKELVEAVQDKKDQIEKAQATVDKINQ